MPEISRFLGMVIRIFYNDHEKPHIHVFHIGTLSKIDFDGNIIKGNLPPNKLKVLKEWIAMHKEELRNNWMKARGRLPIERIEPWKE